MQCTSINETLTLSELTAIYSIVGESWNLTGRPRDLKPVFGASIWNQY